MASRSFLYQSALSRTVKDLEGQMQDRQRWEAERRALLMLEEEKARRADSEHKLACQKNADLLREQMSLNLLKKLEQRREQKRSGIDPSFSGFPNIPETPATLKFQRKRVQQQEMKDLLEKQIKEREERDQLKKMQTLSSEMECNERVRLALERHTQEQSMKLTKQREDMRKAWQDAEYTKLLMKSLDGNVPLPVTSSMQAVLSLETHQESIPSLSQSPTSQPSPISEDSPLSMMEEAPTDQNLAQEAPAAETPALPSKTVKTHEGESLGASLRVPQPTVQQYRASDFRDSSLCKGRKTTVAIASVAPLARVQRSHSNPKGSEWGFVTSSDPVPQSNRRALIRGAGLRILKSQTLISQPVIATTKTMQLQKAALPQYGMLLTKPKDLNNV